MAKSETAPEKIEVTITDEKLIYLLWLLAGERSLEEVIITGLRRFVSISSTMHEIGFALRKMDCSKEEIISVLSIFSSPIMAGRVVSSLFGSGDNRRGLNHLLHMKRKHKSEEQTKE